MYVIEDKQLGGRLFADGATFKTKEEIRQQLISYHEGDGWIEPEDRKIIAKMSLDEILDFGGWAIVKAR